LGVFSALGERDGGDGYRRRVLRLKTRPAFWPSAVAKGLPPELIVRAAVDRLLAETTEAAERPDKNLYS